MPLFNKVKKSKLFQCPYCGTTVIRTNTRQRTCRGKECQKIHAREIKRIISRRNYDSKKDGLVASPHAGMCLCLRCEKEFKSPNKTKIRVCNKCRTSFELARKEYCMVPCGM